MEAHTRTRLEHVHHEVLTPLALLNLSRSRDDGVGCLLIDQAQIAVSLCGCFFDHGDGADQRDMRTQAADGIVLDRAGGLYAVINISGNIFQAERVFFRADGHARASGSVMITESPRLQRSSTNNGGRSYAVISTSSAIFACHSLGPD